MNTSHARRAAPGANARAGKLRVAPSLNRSTKRRPSARNEAAGASLHATDPRWVLAVRVGEAMEGQVLRPDRRERLIRAGRVMGLNNFEANLVIAIVQDQVRRGLSPAEAGKTLGCVPISKSDGGRWRMGKRSAPGWQVALWCVALAAVEAAAWWVIWGGGGW